MSSAWDREFVRQQKMKFGLTDKEAWGMLKDHRRHNNWRLDDASSMYGSLSSQRIRRQRPDKNVGTAVCLNCGSKKHRLKDCPQFNAQQSHSQSQVDVPASGGRWS